MNGKVPVGSSVYGVEYLLRIIEPIYITGGVKDTLTITVRLLESRGSGSTVEIVGSERGAPRVMTVGPSWYLNVYLM